MVALLVVTLMVAMLTDVQAACTGIDQCTDCNNPPVLCYRCPPGYLLKGDGSKCVACEANCVKCEFDDSTEKTWQKCTACGSGYQLSNGDCEACDTNCAKCEYKDGDITKPLICTECLPSHKPSSDTSCEACPSRCMTCSTASCSKCSPGYLTSSADANVCLTCPTVCKACSNTVKAGSTAVCTGCKDRYYLKDGTCQGCTSNCKKCMETEAKCAECDLGFTLSASGTCSFSCPSGNEFTGCKDCGTENPAVCVLCGSGLGIKSKAHKSCDACVSNCVECDDLTCSKCADKYVLDITTKTCKKCPSNCKVCEMRSGVAHCKTNECEGYRVKDADGQCADCPDYCVSCTWDTTNSRTACKSGSCTNTGISTQGATLDDSGQCQLCPHDKCSDCTWNSTTSDTRCTKCSDMYGLKDASSCEACDECKYCLLNTTSSKMDCWCSDLTTAPNCGTSGGAAEFRCTCGSSNYVCPEGYAYRKWGELNSAKEHTYCEACDSNCKLCNTTLWCLQCKDGHAGPTTGDGTCLPCPDNCDMCEFTDSTQVATKCMNNKCSSRYTNQEDGCTSCGTGCSKCAWNTANSAVSCTTCDSGYAKHTSNSVAKCYKCDTGCTKCSYDGTSKTCNTCASKYTLDGAVCQACPGNCNECEMKDGAVICSDDKCDHGFAEVNGVCVACAEHCKRCETSANTNAVCEDTYCDTGYGKLESGECSACPSHCDSCPLTTVNSVKILVCDNCANYYGLNNNYCAACSSHCSQCEDSTESPGSMKCNKCDLGYTLSGNECKACPVNCNATLGCTAGATRTQCNRCNKGYDLDSDKQCVSCSSLTTVVNCATCDRTKCLTCTSGNTISEDNTECLDSSGLEFCTWKRDLPNQCSKCDDGYEQYNEMTECRLFCLTCGIAADGTVAPDTACNDENRNHSSEVCPAGGGFYCGVARYKDTQEASRGCKNGTCDSFVETETDYQGRTLTAKCCLTSNCNDEILDGIAGVSSLRTTFLIILLTVISTLTTSAL